MWCWRWRRIDLAAASICTTRRRSRSYASGYSGDCRLANWCPRSPSSAGGDPAPCSWARANESLWLAKRRFSIGFRWRSTVVEGRRGRAVDCTCHRGSAFRDAAPALHRGSAVFARSCPRAGSRQRWCRSAHGRRRSELQVRVGAFARSPPGRACTSSRWTSCATAGPPG